MNTVAAVLARKRMKVLDQILSVGWPSICTDDPRILDFCNDR